MVLLTHSDSAEKVAFRRKFFAWHLSAERRERRFYRVQFHVLTENGREMLRFYFDTYGLQEVSHCRNARSNVLNT
ncbi:hypothetical protein OUZ56_022866 [Daphnia magna]|uniref:Uncharacterized protein n=1 Tax=Daphnia magna TaxID=35525 RepID=A0ABR0AXP7_9CRUS|nr:hypothetical protein OUZ56_022866 [Daphnia magna]